MFGNIATKSVDDIHSNLDEYRWDTCLEALDDGRTLAYTFGPQRTNSPG